MRFLRFTLLAVVAAAASAFAAVPASAQTPPSKPQQPGPEQNVSCAEKGTIKLDKRADKTEYKVGELVTFKLTVRVDYCNASKVIVHDQLPTGLKVADPALLTHDYGPIAAGGEKSYTLLATALTKGVWTNRAQADAIFVGAGDGCAPKTPASSPASAGRINERSDPPRVQTCQKSAYAKVPINVIEPPGQPKATPTPTQPGQPKATPTPTQPGQPKATPTATPKPGQPSGPKYPSLPNTGRQE